jgi:site-specific DNA-cytosine methylase
MLGVTAALLQLWRPRCWLVGNVPGLDDGPNASALQRTLGTLTGHYCIDYVSLDAAAYGVPQHRVRPFWFGHPSGTPCIAWPRPTHGCRRNQLQIAGTELFPYVTVREALAHLSCAGLGTPNRVRTGSTRHDHPCSEIDRPAGTFLSGQPNNCGNVIAFGRGDHHRVSGPDRPARTLTRNTHSDGALLLNDKHPINHPDAPSYTITSRDRAAQGSSTTAWPWDRPSTVVTARDELAQCNRNGRRGDHQSANAIKLSEKAAAILQGFPEGWQFVGQTKRSRWSQIGQAMPPPLSAAVARSVEAWLRAPSSVELARACEQSRTTESELAR